MYWIIWPFTGNQGHDQNVQYEKTSNHKIKSVKVYNNMQKARMILIQELVQK